MTSKRFRRPALALAALLTSSALVLTACGSSGDSASSAGAGSGASTGTTSGPGVHGGTLTFYDPVQYEDWVPTNSLWSDSNVADNIGERLLWQDDKTGKLEPWLASSWSLSSDHLTYTFHLKPGVKFTDGTALTAQVVKDNFDQHAYGDKKLGIPVDGFWPAVDAITAVNSSTLTIKLKQPDAAFAQLMSNYRASTILAESFVKQNLAGQSKISNWVGTGPFEYASGDGINEVVLKANPHYTSWPTGSAHTGEPYLNEIDFKYVPEEATRIGALQSGDAQIVRNLSPTDEQTVSSYGGQLKAFAVQGESNAFQVQVNRPGLVTDDKDVRLALQAATNRTEINQVALSPNYGIPIGPLVKGTPDAPDLSSYLKYDPNKANSLLTADGWALNSDGYRYKNGQQLRIDVWVAPYYQVSEAVLEVLQSEWKKVGINLNIQSVSLDEYESLEAAHKFTLSQGQESSADPGVLDVSWNSTLYNDLGENAGGADKTLNKLVAAINTTFAPAARAAAVKKASEYAFSQGYNIPLYDETQIFGLASSVHGFATESTARAWLYDTYLSK